MHDALFADPGRLDDPHLWERAERLGLDLDRFEADRRGRRVRPCGSPCRCARLRAGVTATPTLFVDGVDHPGADRTLRLLGPGPPTPDDRSSMVRFG